MMVQCLESQLLVQLRTSGPVPSYCCLYPLTCDMEVITVTPAPVVALRIK